MFGTGLKRFVGAGAALARLPLRHLAIALLLLAGAALLWPLPGVAQSPPAAPPAAFVTLLNPAAVDRQIQFGLLAVDGSTVLLSTHRVEAGESTTFPLEPGTEPIDYRATCNGCRPASFSLAAGQRIIVTLLSPADQPLSRSDLHLVNESGQRQQGVLRTGVVLGGGRSVLHFDLLPEESAAIGLRLAPQQTVDFNLTCQVCTPQTARLRYGVDLELVIR